MGACERSGRRAASVAAIALLTMMSVTAARADGFPNGVTPPGASSTAPSSSVGSNTMPGSSSSGGSSTGSGSMESTMPAKSDLSSSKISLNPNAPWMGAGVMGNNDSGGSPTMSASDALPPILPELNSAATGNAPVNPGSAVGNDIGNTGLYGGQGTGDMGGAGTGTNPTPGTGTG